MTILLLLALLQPVQAAQAAPELVVGSKRFTESTILGEILTRTAARAQPARHAEGLGNTAIVVAALRNGDIDLYPEYLGTIDSEILHHDAAPDRAETQADALARLNRELAPMGLGAAIPLGFANTYALAVRAETAASDTLADLADLARHPELRLGLSHEFLGRKDGWPGLARVYHLPQQPQGLDHGLAYEALAQNQVDVIDIYSTDAKIAKFGLKVLSDNARYFPAYDAVVLYRLDAPQRFPAAWAALQGLTGRIDASRMIALNGDAELRGMSAAAIASRFVDGRLEAGEAQGFRQKLFADDFWLLARQHLTLVLASVLAATLIGIPLGLLAARLPRGGGALLALVGALQTIPSLALLAFLIPVVGTIGAWPAGIALFIYALLPVVRNTCVGIQQVPAGLKLAALALGLSQRDRMVFIELPLARRVILAGIKTAAVINVGTATIAAFIGAGGFGQRIAIGLALNDHAMLLAGAIPAAALALLIEAGFAGVDRLFAKASAEPSA